MAYVHLADAPGRQEPGTGAVDWSRWLDAVVAAGYSGSVQLEFVPSTDFGTAVSYIRALVERLG
jgi:hydroxypyruvate isomerase